MPGKYKVLEIKDYGLTETADGKPRVEVVFEHQYGDSTRTLTWRGYLTEKSTDMTVEQLVRAGFKGNNLVALLEPGAFEKRDDVEIEVAQEEYDGKQSLKVKWINRKFTMKKIDPRTAVQKLKGLDLRGNFLAARQKIGDVAEVQNTNDNLDWGA